LRAGAVRWQEASRDHQKAEHGQPGESKGKPVMHGESLATELANQECTDNREESEQ
jgi:hypothetical protein